MKAGMGWLAGLGLAAMYSFAHAADESIDCVRNTPSKMSCSVAVEKTGVYRLKMRAELQANAETPGTASVFILMQNQRKPCAEEKDIPVKGETVIEALCTWRMVKGKTYAVTATSMAKGADPKSILLTVERTGK